MTRVATDSDEPLLSVPADAREKLYAEIPQLQCLQYWLEEDPQLQNDFRDPELDDYRAGSFYWAIRRAAQHEAFMPTLPPPMPIGRAQPMPSMLPVITAPCPPAAAGAAPPASPSVRSMYCPQSGKLPRAPFGPDLPGLPGPLPDPALYRDHRGRCPMVCLPAL